MEKSDIKKFETAITGKKIEGKYSLPDGYVLDFKFQDISFKNCEISKGSFSCSIFQRCTFDRSIFSNVCFEFSTFIDCSFVETFFKKCFLEKIKFINCNNKPKINS